MALPKTMDRVVLGAAVIGSLVLLNFLGTGVFWRLDLTRDKIFTLSEATTDLLANLPDPVTVRAYFTEDLPQPYASNRRYVLDLLEEYFAHSEGNFRYEFIDPARAETAEDEARKKNTRRDIFGRTLREPTSIERELNALGIPPVQIQVNEGDKLEIKRAYMGLAIISGEEKAVLPVVQKTSGLEYELTTLIRKLTRSRTPKVALITGHDGLDRREELSRLNGLLEQLYEVTTVDLSTEGSIPADVDTILVIAPRTRFSEAELRALDEFVMSGRSAAFLLSEVVPEFQTLTTREADHGLTDLLAGYGVRIDSGLVLDPECGMIGVSRQQGFMVINQPVRYPYLPVPKRLDPQHPLTRGLTNVAFAFMSPLTVTVSEDSGVVAEVLVRSSERSWIETPPYNLDPFQQWSIDATRQGARPLVVTLSGPIPSHFANSGEEEQISMEPALQPEVAANARILVAGGASFLTDQLMSPGNEAFVFNLMDWLVLDEALLAVRSRGLAAAPLDEIGARARSTIKLLHILGLPLVCVLFGLIRWRWRESRRSTVTV